MVILAPEQNGSSIIIIITERSPFTEDINTREEKKKQQEGKWIPSLTRNECVAPIFNWANRSCIQGGSFGVSSLPELFNTQHMCLVLLLYWLVHCNNSHDGQMDLLLLRARLVIYSLAVLSILLAAAARQSIDLRSLLDCG